MIISVQVIEDTYFKSEMCVLFMKSCWIFVKINFFSFLRTINYDDVPSIIIIQ